MDEKGLLNGKKKQLRVKVYLNPALFAEVALQAEKTGFRRKGLPLFTQKPHGFVDEKVANTDGMAKFFKHCYKFWKESEARRLEEAAKIAQMEKELADRKAKLGLG